jgi:hypothetical protein
MIAMNICYFNYYIKNTIPVIPFLPGFDRFLIISIFERKKGGGV